MDHGIVRQSIEAATEQVLETLEKHILHNPYDQERREMDAIRTGDAAALHSAIMEDFIGNYGILAEDPLRQEKMLLVKNLLTYSLYPCSQIAAHLGFSSQSHLGSDF